MIRIAMALILGAATVYAFYHRIRMEKSIDISGIKPGRKTFIQEPLLLLMGLAVFAIILPLWGSKSIAALVLAQFGLTFIYVSIYYGLLLLLLPLLRRVISARACATLWMLPTLMYLTLHFINFQTTPLFIITLPRQRLYVFLAIWAAGFLIVTLWQLISHLRFRRSLLKNAEKVTEPSLLFMWRSGLKKHGIKAEIPVMTSDSISTPLTVGCFDRTMRLILPRQSYTEAELALIFRHELRHIIRADARTKVLISFCAAVCWFNPLGWVARHKVSDDLELSCDEAVLEGADENVRMQYAELLLKNSGDSRGYSTCLSASAHSLRYRLRSITKPTRRIAGGAVTGIAVFALMMILNTVAFADSPGTVQELIFDKAPSEIDIKAIYASRQNDEWPNNTSVYKWNEKLLTEYLASLRVRQIYPVNYNNYQNDKARWVNISYGEYAGGELKSLTMIDLYDNLLLANIPYDGYDLIAFAPEGDIDWSYIDSLLDWDAKNPDPSPVPPEMMMRFSEEINPDGALMYAARSIISVTRRGVMAIQNTGHEGVGGVACQAVTSVELSFSYEPLGDYIVKAENWDRTSSYTVLGSELADNTLPLAPYSAHYTVSGSFKNDGGTVYKVEFYFDVDLTES